MIPYSGRGSAAGGSHFRSRAAWHITPMTVSIMDHRRDAGQAASSTPPHGSSPRLWTPACPGVKQVLFYECLQRRQSAGNSPRGRVRQPGSGELPLPEIIGDRPNVSAFLTPPAWPYRPYNREEDAVPPLDCGYRTPAAWSLAAIRAVAHMPLVTGASAGVSHRPERNGHSAPVGRSFRSVASETEQCSILRG